VPDHDEIASRIRAHVRFLLIAAVVVLIWNSPPTGWRFPSKIRPNTPVKLPSRPLAVQTARILRPASRRSRAPPEPPRGTDRCGTSVQLCAGAVESPAKDAVRPRGFDLRPDDGDVCPTRPRRRRGRAARRCPERRSASATRASPRRRTAARGRNAGRPDDDEVSRRLDGRLRVVADVAHLEPRAIQLALQVESLRHRPVPRAVRVIAGPHRYELPAPGGHVRALGQIAPRRAVAEAELVAARLSVGIEGPARHAAEPAGHHCGPDHEEIAGVREVGGRAEAVGVAVTRGKRRADLELRPGGARHVWIRQRRGQTRRRDTRRKAASRRRCISPPSAGRWIGMTNAHHAPGRDPVNVVRWRGRLRRTPCY